MQGDFSQLGGARVRVHHAVSIHQHLLGEQHKEHRRHQGAARRGLDQLQGRADGVGGGVDHSGYQTVDLIQCQHHGADHHRVFQLLLGHRCVEALGLAQGHHRLDITTADQVGVEDFQAFRQFEAVGLGHCLDFFRLGQ